VRYWDHDMLSDHDAVLEDILRALKETPHPTPLPKGRGRKSPFSKVSLSPTGERVRVRGNEK
jgi:hypothetical protein